MTLNTKVLMIASASLMALLGVGASFLPEELLQYVGAPPNPMMVLFLQMAGALYLGFAVLNWTAKANIIGGIYGRPVALGNFLHFTVVAIALAKMVLDGYTPAEVVTGALIYALLAVAFGVVLFTHPGRQKK